PSGQHGYEAERAHRHAKPEKPGTVEQTTAIAQPPAHRHRRQHQKSDADHDAESEEGNRHRRPIPGLELFEALDLAMETMGQDEAAEIGYLDRVAIGLVGRVGNGEQSERKGRLSIPARLDGGNFRRLIHGGVESVLVAQEYL